jgi:hypothetical protein
LTELNDSGKKEFGITQSNSHLLPTELITPHVFAALFIPHTHHPSLLFVEEISLCWVVRQTEPDQNRTCRTEEAFNNVNPSSVTVSFKIFFFVSQSSVNL